MVHLTAQQPEEHTASCQSNEEAAIEIGPRAGAYPTRSQNPVPSTVHQWNGAAPVVNGQLCLGSREPTPSHLTKAALFASLEVIGFRLRSPHPFYQPVFLLYNASYIFHVNRFDFVLRFAETVRACHARKAVSSG
jgi:hypothetical protein